MRPLKNAALGGVMLAVAAPAAVAATWEFASPYPSFNFHGRNAQIFIEEVARTTEGEVEINYHGGASLYALPEIKRAVRTRQIAIGELLVSTMENEDPIFGVDSIPFLANDFDRARALWLVSRDAVAERLAEQGLTLLYGVSWPGQGLFTAKPIESVADLEGLKMRIQNPATAAMAELFDAVPVRVESADIPQAMETGIIEAFFTSASTGADKNAWDYISHFYDVMAYVPKNVTFVNTAMLESLAPEHQQAVMAAAAAAEARGWAMMENEIRVKQARLCAEVTCPDPIPAELTADLEAIGEELTARWLESAGEEGEAMISDYRSLAGTLY
jgi:TRAP-type C4-dicarboxylate transport system substrate-binding protein